MPLKREPPRCIWHYQYLSWPDHGVPNEPGGVLSFLEQVNRTQSSIPESGPIVVHCRYCEFYINQSDPLICADAKQTYYLDF